MRLPRGGVHPRTTHVSIHAPWEGCDNLLRFLSSSGLRFNSRTLGRVRLHVAYEDPDLTYVSIHAPWEGCDASTLAQNKFIDEFQFTHPGKGATSGHKPTDSRQRGFNSRTLGRVRRVSSSLTAIPRAFQFTHPGKGATVGLVDDEVCYLVSIHAPWEGCDSFTLQRYNKFVVSIHAPWEGCDSRQRSLRELSRGFNSRTLGRVRQCGAKLRIIGRINKRNLRLGVLS